MTRESSSPSGDGPRSRHWSPAVVALAALGLALHVLLVAWASVPDSPAWCEPANLLAGISHWEFGKFDLYRVNPPLVRLVAVLPVLCAKPRTDWRDYSDSLRTRAELWMRDDFIQANGGRIFWLHTLARWACIPFTLLGAYVSFRWAARLWGRLAGVLALSLWCLSPNVLAHAHLITPDLGAAAMGVSAGYAFWLWANCRTWTHAFIAGAVLGLAALAKTTWVLLFALFGALPLLSLWRRSEKGRLRSWLRQIGQVGLMLIIALYTLNLGYAFELSFRSLGEYRFLSSALGGPGRDDRPVGGNRFAGGWLGSIPVPLPANYVAGIDLQKWDFERKMWSYLRGEWRLGGWWYYYLYAMAIKVPVGTWVLGALAVLLSCTDCRYRAGWPNEIVVLAPAAAVLLLVSSQTGFNHHMRYVLPAFPFLFIWISKVGRAFQLGQRPAIIIAAVALLWSAGSSLWIYPHSLSYFNELVGGPRHGHAHLLDSNIDWGQDLLYLKRWLDAHPEARLMAVAYRNCYRANLAGIDDSRKPPPGPTRPYARAFPAHGIGPLPGWYAISVHLLRHRHEKYKYFLEHFEPAATAGYSIYIYHISLQEANRVRRKLALPPVKSREQRAGSGMQDAGCGRHGAGIVN